MAHSKANHHRVQENRSPERFLEWLKRCLCVIEHYVENERQLPMGCTEFEYFTCSDISNSAWKRLLTEVPEPDSTGTLARLQAFEDPRRGPMKVGVADDAQGTGVPSWLAQFRSRYKADFENGDTNALLELARDDREALEENWVIAQLLAWRKDGSARAKRNFDRFMRAYWSRQGKRRDKTTLAVIQRDQAIYQGYVQRGSQQLKTVHVDLANTHKIGVETVKSVIKHYNSFYSSGFAQIRLPPLLLSR